MKLITSYLHMIHGDDATAVVDDESRPFKTHAAAMRALLPYIADANNCTRIVDISGQPPKEPAPPAAA